MTHIIGPDARSWVASANAVECEFPIQNLPYGIYSTADKPSPRVGVAIGDLILDLSTLDDAGLLPDAAGAYAQGSLNGLIACGRDTWRRLRASLAALLAEGGSLGGNDRARAAAFVPRDRARLHLPVVVGNYTDFYSSRHHAQNVGALFRDPARALNPNWLEMPVGYHGRASSVVVSGTQVRRPLGQVKKPGAERPVLAACERLDFELELGTVIGRPTELGERVSIEDAESHIFGVVLLNDWSARDIQLWEAQPLGPFNAKNFATTISPWVVPLDALEPFRCAQPAQDPAPLDYLRARGDQGFDIALDVSLTPDGAAEASTIVRSNFAHMYWSMAQQVAHHTVGGCNLQVGDLLGSGTISGPEPHSCGCLLEQTFNGTRPLPLSGGGTRAFLHDGDTVTMRGHAQGDGYRVGFGVCEGKVKEALLF